MTKPILLQSVDHAMLDELARKNRQKIDQVLHRLIQEAYAKLK